MYLALDLMLPASTPQANHRNSQTYWLFLPIVR
jgi:hypothetical protein